MTDIIASGNVIRITNQRSQRVYITYILRVLEGGPDANGTETQKSDTVIIRAMGRAIHSAVNIAEVIKRRVVGLHQIVSISSETVQDSNKEDAPPVAETDDAKAKGDRKASVITIQLSRNALDTHNVGYQAPLPESMVSKEPEPEARTARREGGTRTGSGRGGRRDDRPVSGRGGRRDDRPDRRDDRAVSGRGGRRDDRPDRRDDRPVSGRGGRRDDRPVSGRGGRRDDRPDRRDDRPAPARGGRGGYRYEEDEYNRRGGARPPRDGYVAARDEGYAPFRGGAPRGGRGGAPRGGRPAY